MNMVCHITVCHITPWPLRSEQLMTAPEPSSLIPVTVLTGFLGSGKTTVLNHVLKQPDMAATAVIVNEFGEIGLDHLLVERSSEASYCSTAGACAAPCAATSSTP